MSELQLFHMGFQIEEIGKYQAFRKKEESEFQTQFARIIGELNLD